MRYLTLLSVVLVIGAMCSSPSIAFVGWSENFDGANPLANWVTNAGTPTVTSAPTNPMGLSFVDADGTTTRISRVFDNSGASYVKLSFYFYNNSSATSTQRAVGAFHNGSGGVPGANPGLMRLGTNNASTYQFLYYTTATVTVNTGVPISAGVWHYATIEADLTTKSIRWTLDGVSGIVSNPQLTAAYFPNMVTLGNNYSNGSVGAPDTSTWFDGVVVSNLLPNSLMLNVQGLNVQDNTLYVPYGAVVSIKMDVANLMQKVNGCQAMLGYSNYYLFAQSGCVAPGGGVWDQLIYNSWDVGSGEPGEIDTAIGVDAQGAVGTDADGTVANIQLVARDKDGVTQVVFRPDVSDVECTWLSDMNSLPIIPNKTNTQNIVIDGTPAALQIASATQLGNELLTSLGSTTPAVQGRVDFLVTASDLNGLPAAPAVNVYDSALVPIPCVFDGQVPYGSGNYYYHINVPPTAANGQATIRAAVFDKAGNRTDDLDHFLIDKNQITGQVECEGFVGSSRNVTFVATGATTKSWTLTLTGWSANKSSYTLTGVPAGTTGLSAKSAWSLRSKLPIMLADGQGTADFVGSDMLLGGDLNESNSINVLDYSIMKSYWYTTSPLADIDGSGLVQTADYNTMKANWFKLGDDL